MIFLFYGMISMLKTSAMGMSCRSVIWIIPLTASIRLTDLVTVWYYVVGDPIYFESEEIESMTFLEHAVPYIESKPEAGYYDPDLEMKYAKVDEGIVVLYMTEWYLCVPADTAISD